MGENEEESQELAEAQTCDGHWKCLRCGEVRWPVGGGGDETMGRWIFVKKKNER